MKAYILLSTKPGTSLEVVKRLKERVKETITADAIFGRYDAIVILEAPALESAWLRRTRLAATGAG